MSVRQCGSIRILESFHHLMQPNRYICAIFEKKKMIDIFDRLKLNFPGASNITDRQPALYFPVYPAAPVFPIVQWASIVQSLPFRFEDEAFTKKTALTKRCSFISQRYHSASTTNKISILLLLLHWQNDILVQFDSWRLTFASDWQRGKMDAIAIRCKWKRFINDGVRCSMLYDGISFKNCQCKCINKYLSVSHSQNWKS